MPSIYAANDGTVYEKSMGRWSRRLAMPFIKFSEISGSLQSVLDVGCGTGSLAFALGEVAPTARITGLDYSQAFVDYARSQVNSDRFSFDQGDAMSLPYEAATFDAAMSLLVLGFLSEPARAVREMVRVTRPGGWSPQRCGTSSAATPSAAFSLIRRRPSISVLLP
jgi:ubiquinone/menaquinone biosynthesis C-methylase UbiE